MDNQNIQADISEFEPKTHERFCLICKKKLRGRSDKKFCNEICRNGFYNQLNAQTNNLVRNINHALGKNRRVLESFFVRENKVITASAHQLLIKGFQFKYFTHQYTNKKGNTYFFCYDYGYLALEDRYLLVKGKGE